MCRILDREMYGENEYWVMLGVQGGKIYYSGPILGS
jgi:hypothetical protein